MTADRAELSQPAALHCAVMARIGAWRGAVSLLLDLCRIGIEGNAM